MARNRTHTRAAKRQSTWIGPADQGYVPVGSAGAAIISTFDPDGASLIAPTIIRTRGQVSTALSVGIAGDVDVIGAYGMCIVSDNAAGIGITAVPLPFDDAAWGGWFVWRSFSMRYEFTSGVDARFTMQSEEVDSKAMRKVSTDETILIVAQSQVGAFDISAPLRLLLKLS